MRVEITQDEVLIDGRSIRSCTAGCRIEFEAGQKPRVVAAVHPHALGVLLRDAELSLQATDPITGDRRIFQDVEFLPKATPRE